MPLFIGGQRLDVSQPIARILQMHDQLQERAKDLISQPLQMFGPKGFLYIQQRELAATTPNDSSISVLGSEDATTCHIIVLRDAESGAICLAHCDGSDTDNEVASVIEAVKSLLNSAEGSRTLGRMQINPCSGAAYSSSFPVERLELHIVGGFNDKRQLSQNLSQQLLRAFDNQAEEIHLVTFCVTDLNDKKDDGVHLPIIYGIAVNVKTGEIFKAGFEDHQPDEDLRLAYILAGGNMVNIYDAKSEQLNIGPYSWTPFPNIDFWLEQEYEQILECFSTSPEAEPPHFVRDMRSALLLLKEHPNPCISLFPHGQPRSYKKKNDGQWQKI